MRYTVTIAGSTVAVDVKGGSVLVNGRPVTASMARVPGTPVLHAVIDGRPFTCALIQRPEGWEVLSAGEVWAAEIVDERERALKAMTRQSDARATGAIIRAPMPGLVLRLEVEVGAKVIPATGLLVLEAMKMENEIKAGRAGTVKAIHVQPGQPVEKGAPLVELAEG